MMRALAVRGFSAFLLGPAAILPAGDPCPSYPDHGRLLVVRDAAGAERPVATPADWAVRRRHILCGMEAAMGKFPDRSSLPPLDPRITAEVRLDGFRRLELTFAAEPGDRVPAHLFLPDLPGGRRAPGMLALHQTTAIGKAEPAGLGGKPNLRYGLELARRGYAVLCPDYPSFGDYRYDFGADAHPSGTMKGIVNHVRAVDLLASRPEVDPERIGVIGHSLGGHNAIFAAAFDERLKVVVSSCGWTPFHDYYGGKLAGWTSDRYMPRIRDVHGLDPDRVPFDFHEVVAALAPRAFISVSPLHDDNFSVDGVRKAVAAARAVYELLGAPERLVARHPDCGHDFPPEERSAAYDLIDRALAHAPPAREPPDLKDELPRIAPRPPAEALAAFTVLPGFRVELAAAEPLVTSPVALAFDEDARLFVVEMNDYPESREERLGRVRLLEDADEDGRYERATVYAEGLAWPTAVACWEGGVFIGAAPDILYLKDTDGDGRADVSKAVFTGFGHQNVQGLLNCLQWGPGQRIHGATSTCGGLVRRADSPGAATVDLRGRDFSFDPRSLDLRPESGGAQHGMTFDDWGRKYVSSNSDHIQLVLFEDRYSARNPRLAAPTPRASIAADGPQAEVFRTSPVEPWRIVRTRLRVAGLAPGPIEGGGRAAGYFTGASGVTIYRGDAWLAAYRGEAFVGDVGSNIVHRKVLEEQGTGMVARRADPGREFLASSDNWFRPAAFANGPDGALYIADVHREVIEHPESLPPGIKRHLDLTSGRDRGRIWRIVPEGFRRPPRPRLGRLGTEDLVLLLEHRNGWHRDTAARLLHERGDAAVRPVLERLAASSALPEARAAALEVLRGLGSLSAETSIRALGDEHPRVRERAVLLAEGLARGSADVRARLLALAPDDDARVRLQLAFTLGELDGPERIDALAALARMDGGDPLARFAILNSVGEAAPELLARLASAVDAHREPPVRKVLEDLARHMGLGATEAGVAAAARVIEGVAREDRALALDLLRGLGDGLASRGRRLAGEAAFAGGPGAALLDDLLRGAREAARDPARPVAGRIAAARALGLGSVEGSRDVLRALLGGGEPEDLQRAAVEALGRLPGDGAGESLVATWPRLSPRVRAAAMEVLFARAGRVALLLDAVERGEIPPSDIDPARRKALGSHPDRALRKRGRRILEDARPADRADAVVAYRAALSLPGDRARGRERFEKHCASCHRLDGTGHDLGPGLQAAPGKGAEAILVDVLDPNREVDPRYVAYAVLTRDGRAVTGVVSSESAASVVLRRADGASDTVLRADIAEMRSSGLSLMPEGLEREIDLQGMADLIAFLTSTR
jgi:putative membrane-bound dehydrogenase-like protein